MICEKLHYWNANKYTRTFLTCVSLLEWITRWLADTTNTRDTYWGCHHVNDYTDDQQWRPKWTKLESKAVLWNHSLMMMVAKNQFCGSYPNSLLCFCGLATKVIYLYCWRRQAPLTQSGRPQSVLLNTICPYLRSLVLWSTVLGTIHHHDQTLCPQN